MEGRKEGRKEGVVMQRKAKNAGVKTVTVNITIS